MSRSRPYVGRNREYWSRRFSRWGINALWGRFSKTLTHRLERRTARAEVAEREQDRDA